MRFRKIEDRYIYIYKPSGAMPGGGGGIILKANVGIVHVSQVGKR